MSTASPAKRTYFLLLSPYERRGIRFVRLKSPSVLSWFQRAWSKAAEGEGLWGAELRGRVYGFGSLFDAIVEERLKPPRTEAELIPLLEQHIYYERDIEVEPHFVHVETDDDEVDIEYFFFDDDFLRTPDAIDRLPDPRDRRHEAADDEEIEEDAEGDDEDKYAAFIRQFTEE